MYLPPHFKEERLATLQEAIRNSRLASLITMTPAGMAASHVPLLYDPDPAPYGQLRGHVARANMQWRDSQTDVEALAIFTGPEAYISPAWYPSKKADGKVVPTWNYVAVHAYGRIEFFDDPDRLLAVVTGLTESHEGKRRDPWAVTDAPPDYIRARLKGIVGFAMPIARIEGKWKMSQNQPMDNRQGAREGLEREGQAPEKDTAAIMAELEKE